MITPPAYLPVWPQFPKNYVGWACHNRGALNAPTHFYWVVDGGWNFTLSKHDCNYVEQPDWRVYYEDDNVMGSYIVLDTSNVHTWDELTTLALAVWRMEAV